MTLVTCSHGGALLELGTLLYLYVGSLVCQRNSFKSSFLQLAVFIVSSTSWFVETKLPFLDFSNSVNDEFNLWV